MRSAWAELQRKAVLFYLGTVGTQGEKKSHLFYLQVEILWAQGKSPALIYKAGGHQPLFH